MLKISNDLRATMFIMKEPGCDKWIAPNKSSGFSSNRSNARKFDQYLDAIILLNTDKRYKGLKFTYLVIEYTNMPNE